MAGTLDEYHAKRKELVNKDVSLRQDRAKYTSMGDVEKSAEEIVQRIRKEEALRVWCHEQDLFPGMAFLTGACLNVLDRDQQGTDRLQRGRRSNPPRFSRYLKRSQTYDACDVF